MQICKELFKGKTLSDGSHPVLIRIYHNGVIRRISTSVYIKDKHWNSIRGCISCRDKDYKIKNEMIDTLYRRISGSIQEFIDTKLETELDSIISQYKFEKIHHPKSSVNIDKKEPENASGDNPENEGKNAKSSFIDMVDKKIEATLSLNTRRGYEGFRRYFADKFGNGPEIGYVDQKFTNRFLFQLDKDYEARTSMKHLMISRYNAVLNYARGCGIIPTSEKICLPRYNISRKDRNLNNDEVYSIMSAFKLALESDPRISKPTTMALGLFVLDIAFQGLAPVDLASLRVKSINFLTLHAYQKNPKLYETDMEYRRKYDDPENRIRAVCINTTRKKTGRPVSIVSTLKGIECFLLELIKGKHENDYLIPCFRNDIEYNPNQRQNRLANYFNKMAAYLNDVMDEYYKEHNLGFHPRITYYYARHAFCNLLDSLDVPRHIIQHMVGHRTTVLETSYLRPITQWEQAMLSDRIFSLYFY